MLVVQEDILHMIVTVLGVHPANLLAVIALDNQMVIVLLVFLDGGYKSINPTNMEVV